MLRTDRPCFRATPDAWPISADEPITVQTIKAPPFVVHALPRAVAPGEGGQTERHLQTWEQRHHRRGLRHANASVGGLP